MAGLAVRALPDKTSYKPGEAVSLAGVSISHGDEDVTGEASFLVDDGSGLSPYNEADPVIWGRDDRQKLVVAEARGESCAFRLERARRPWVPAAAALAAALAVAAAALLAANLLVPRIGDDTGSYIIRPVGMTLDEAQAMLDEQTEKSRITVSLAPEMRLDGDGRLRVNFVVADDNNGLSERLEVVQDDAVVYKSGIVPPGNLLEWTGSPTPAHPGPAVATVYAVDGATQGDSGNPVSVEVEIVGNSVEGEADDEN